MITLEKFLLFVFVGSILCNGFYEVTRSQRIFGFWSKFWQHFEMKPKAGYKFNELFPVYRFPEWIRHPLSECIICYSSIYGSIIFWTTWIFQRWYFPAETLPLILVWVAYCISLAPINYFIHKQIK